MSETVSYTIDFSVEQTNAIRAIFISTRKVPNFAKDGRLCVTINSSEAQEIFEICGQIGKMLRDCRSETVELNKL